MNATIKIRVSELNTAFIERIKLLFSDKEDAELTITYNNKQSDYLGTLKKSKQQLEEGKNLVTFTMDELEAYTSKRKAI